MTIIISYTHILQTVQTHTSNSKETCLRCGGSKERKRIYFTIQSEIKASEYNSTQLIDVGQRKDLTFNQVSCPRFCCKKSTMEMDKKN
ncbi:unnamed protein product [Clavelina lepadiformis]|uniref:Uncharacterized protein n=1 Tax=Clavelina lepadiformis TaxID=159417 RepID=A0ABP0FCY4_CLALP